MRRKLADGRTVVHCYAWRGGAALSGVDGPLLEGSPEFAKAFIEARATRRGATTETLMEIIREYRGSSDFPKSPSSKRNYGAALRKIEDKFGTLPLAALAAKGTRGVFMAWRDSMASTPRTADYHWMVLARVLSVAKNRGRIDMNPCERGGRLYEADRAEAVWSEEDLSRLFAVASKEVAAVVMFALWTGQRQGDVLRLPWSAYDGERIRLRQGKAKAHVRVRVTPELKAIIDGLPRVSPVMLTSREKRPWTSDGFRTSFGRACVKAKVEGLTFHDLRGTAVTRLALAGCTVPEIAAITGHSLKVVARMLDEHYLGERAELAESAILKLETRTQAVNGAVNGPERSGKNDA